MQVIVCQRSDDGIVLSVIEVGRGVEGPGVDDRDQRRQSLAMSSSIRRAVCRVPLRPRFAKGRGPASPARPRWTARASRAISETEVERRRASRSAARARSSGMLMVVRLIPAY